MKSKALAVIVADLAVVLIGYILSLWVRLEFNVQVMLQFEGFFRLLPIVLIIYLCSFIVFKIHKAVLSAASIGDGISIVSANLLATLILTCLKTQFSVLDDMPGSVILISFFVVTIFNVTIHFYSRGVLTLRHRHNQKTTSNATLIYGAGNAGRLLIKEILQNDDYEYRVLGFVDDNPSLIGFDIDGYPVVGNGQSLKRLVKQKKVNQVIIAMPSVTNGELKRISNLVFDSGAKVVHVMSSVALTDPNNVKNKLRKIDIKDLLNRSEVRIDSDGILEKINGKKVIVTGAGGSIGSELVRQIIQYKPTRIVLFDINETGLYAIEQELMIHSRKNITSCDTEIKAVIGSIRDENRLEALFSEEKFDLVFHAAAHKHVPLMETSPQEAIKNNIFGTKNLIDVSIKYGVETFVNISTDKAVNPTNVMGATKRFIEMMIQSQRCMKSNTKFVAVRFGNVLGSNGSVIPLFQKQIEEGGPVTVTDPNIVRYFMTIPEAVSLVLQASAYALGGEIFVLDMGKPVKIDDLARKMIRLSGYEPDKDIEIQYTGLRPGEKLYEELLMGTETLRKTDNKLIYVATPTLWKDDDIQSYLTEIEASLYKENSNDIKIILKKVVKTYT
ncbi:hypothetical protein AOC36_08675 [Erysipelothrix larvae]|uniref:Polysaccharide biosynthesis protein CapD-like domain-containing protein n=1 Tax=Erysipelothrix larvae TaxID=1514105 RepID=A0A0X8H0W7_9FIRM|nr:nucleoside-diphosphate sugar epimerase/dehydratase [Erysipelothrix larvae]AMC94059.1 hypothetical protein AOC36_08675 [Erysipelothrix larvae]